MKTRFLIVFAAAALVAVGQAQAGDGLYLTSDYSHADRSNAAAVTFDGNDNGLFVLQTFHGDGGHAGPNALSVNITGDLDGGPLNAAFGVPLASVGLTPGQLIQTGHDNTMSFTVNGGSRNFFAASQVGAHNMLTAMITGTNNQAAVSQTGSGNSLSFTQNGYGNRLTVIQRSY
jgi:hypothetical protein